jgi:hypothetical protein
MKNHPIQLELPHSVYERLAEVAEASGWKLEDVVLQSLKGGMPPSLGKVPVDFHGELLGLNKLNDQQLWEVVQGKRPKADKGESLEAQKADLPTLRKAYAFALLKWRGHPMPDPQDFLV